MKDVEPIDDQATDSLRAIAKGHPSASAVTNDKGVTVNRWNSTALLISSASSNESGYISVKVARGLGMVALDTQARI